MRVPLPLSLLLLTFIGLALAAGFLIPEPVNWEETYSRFDKNPLGSSVLWQQLPALFPEASPDSRNQHPAFNIEETFPYQSALIINKNFSPSPFEEKNLFRFVSAGGYVLLFAEEIKESVLDSLGLDLDGRPHVFPESRFHLAGANPDSALFSFQPVYLTAERFFSADSTSWADTLVTDRFGTPVVLTVNWGNGKFILGSAPWLFTNIELLKPGNTRLQGVILSELPKGKMLWDEAFKSGRFKSQGMVNYLMNQPGIRQGWLLFWFGAGLYLLVNFRRIQRPIPVIPKPENSSLKFIDVLVGLYQLDNQHSRIAKKRIRYWLMTIREHYNLQTGQLDAAFIQTLASRSGLEEHRLASGILLVTNLLNSTSCRKEDLISLSHFLDYYYFHLSNGNTHGKPGKPTHA